MAEEATDELGAFDTEGDDLGGRSTLGEGTGEGATPGIPIAEASGLGEPADEEPAGDEPDADELPVDDEPLFVVEDLPVQTPADPHGDWDHSNLVELEVTEVRAAVPLRPGQEAGLAVLAERSEPFRSLHIYIGQPEARAIQAGQRGDRPSRPSTWDLLLGVADALGGELVRAVIDGVEEARHFYASIEVKRGDQAVRIACRPSDAVALAVRASGAGLYATEDVIDAAGRYPS